MPSPLPIDEVIPRLHEALAQARSVILSAEPGAGKTTRVPLSLLDARWLAGKRVVMLEPRRLAARRAAEYMASLLGEEAGETVGYRIRGETRYGSHTRVEVVTEGVLTRILHDAPELPGVGVVIFDEFHERSIHADMGLAFMLDIQAHLRPDVKILVMSATLDHVAVSSLLDDAVVIQSKGKIFPVETRFLSLEPSGAVERVTSEAIARALREESRGDVLVFLPGQREIRRTAEFCREKELPNEIVVCELYGDATPDRQREALRPARKGMRKVILSSSIAETSLTIEGVRIVIDAGLSRLPRFDPRRGMAGLVTVPVSQASADQRRGRAGRQEPGVCYRLWTEAKHSSLSQYTPPEILSADLAPLALDLARWGAAEAGGLKFLDPPPTAHLQQARSLLVRLKALDDRGGLTEHGKAMSVLPVHPRLAHMLIRARAFGCGATACEVAALLEERDLLRGVREGDVDLNSRLYILRHGGAPDITLLERIRSEALRLQRLLDCAHDEACNVSVGLLLALAYPDRIARRRSKEGASYQTAAGTGAILPARSLLDREEFLAIGEVDGVGREVRIGLAASLTSDDIRQGFQDELVDEESVLWDPVQEAVLGRRAVRLKAIAIEEHASAPRGEVARSCVIQGIRQLGLQVLPWDMSVKDFRRRCEWIRMKGLGVGEGGAQYPWPDLSDGWLCENLDMWLSPFLGDVLRRSQFGRIDLLAALRSLFTSRQLHEVESLAPAMIAVPTGSRIRLDYSGEIPVLAVKLQELFGESETPCVGNGRIKVLIHLLSPAGRPLAVTQDLPSFWKNGYPEVRREMRGRYPKHPWPEDPFAAIPTQGAKRRR